MTVKIEVIAAPGCQKCAGAQGELRAVAASLLGESALAWREVNILEELDYAVSLGVLSMPAIAINGELKFSSLPTPEQFRAELTSIAIAATPDNAPGTRGASRVAGATFASSRLVPR